MGARDGRGATVASSLASELGEAFRHAGESSGGRNPTSSFIAGGWGRLDGNEGAPGIRDIKDRGHIGYHQMNWRPFSSVLITPPAPYMTFVFPETLVSGISWSSNLGD